MTLPPLPQPSRGLQITKIILYILAGIVLILGVIAGASLMSSAPTMVANLLIPLQLIGAEAISNMIQPVLSGFLTNLGIAAIIAALVISALLYTAGLLVGRIANLEARLAHLEAETGRSA